MNKYDYENWAEERRKFQSDLKIGEIGEELVMRHFRNQGYTVKDVSKDKNFYAKDVDFIYEVDGCRFEVKTDRMFHKTGNLALESDVFYSDGRTRESWLWTSEADWFCFVSPSRQGSFAVISSEVLRDLVKKGCCRYVMKNDGERILGLYLLPYDSLKSHFVIEKTGLDRYGKPIE